jgi:hypothetical protein
LELLHGVFVQDDILMASLAQGSKQNTLVIGLARLLFVVIYLFAIGWFIFNVSPSLERYRTVCTGSDCSYFMLYPGAEEQLAQIGLTPTGYALTLHTLDTLVLVVFTMIAWFIFFHRSHTLIGWSVATALVLVGVGAASSGVTLANTYPLAVKLFTIMTNLAFLMLFFLFPDGQFFPRWNRWFFLFGVVSILAFSESPGVIVFIFAGTYGQLIRYRRISTQAEREQVRWALVGIASMTISVIMWVLVFDVPNAQGSKQPDVLLTLGSLPIIYALISGFPIMLLYAIFRHQFWKIEVVINRALVYTILTLLLALVYFGSVLILQALFATLIGEQSTLAIIISTLAIAALFSPLRSRIQAFIDRRFYRKKYNATQTLSEFAAIARNETDLSSLTGKLLNIVDEAMQPQDVSLWLRASITQSEDHL